MADAALPLVAAGIFDRFPNVRFVLAHGDAGWAMHWLEFTDINFVRHRHLAHYQLQNPDLLPSEYLRRHFWFTVHQDRVGGEESPQAGPYPSPAGPATFLSTVLTGLMTDGRPFG